MVARGSGAEGVKIYSFFGFFFSPERERDEAAVLSLLRLSLFVSLSSSRFKVFQLTRSFVRSLSLSFTTTTTLTIRE
jgi:hypothetical protein